MNLLALLPLILGCPPSMAPAPDQLIYADGRRAPVEDPRKDSKGQWLGTRDGRRVALKAGEIVAIVDDKGKETEILPELAEEQLTPAAEALLAQLRDTRNDDWRSALQTLGARPTRGVHDAMLALSTHKQRELRGRAIWGLCALHTKVSVMAASEAILTEKDAGLRHDNSSALYSVEEIFRRCDSLAAVERGLQDADVGVRLTFATLSPRDHEAGTAVLREVGLTNRDHHVRESSAEELGLRGDAAGESILISMLARTKMPGVDKSDAELGERLLIEEHVRMCAILGKLGSKNGQAALEKALKSPHEAVRDAAKKALDGFAK